MRYAMKARIDRAQWKLVTMAAPKLIAEKAMPLIPPTRVVAPATATIAEMLAAKRVMVAHV